MQKLVRTTKQVALDREKILHILAKEDDAQHDRAREQFKRKPYDTTKGG